MVLCLLDVLEVGVEVDELLVHLIKLLAKVGGEFPEKLLHDNDNGSHGSLWSPDTSANGLARRPPKGGGYGGGGQLCVMVWTVEGGVTALGQMERRRLG